MKVEMEMNRNGFTVFSIPCKIFAAQQLCCGKRLLQVVSQATKSYLCNCMMTIVKTAKTFRLTFR